MIVDTRADGSHGFEHADVWAFGCVLFEALTGKNPFEGDRDGHARRSGRRGARLELRPASGPSSIRRLLRRALIKGRAHRLPHIGAARLELDDVEENAAVQSTAAPSRKLVLVAALTAAVLTGFFVWTVMRPVAPPPVRLAVSAPGQEPFYFGGNPPTIAITPDGRSVIYRAGMNARQLNVRRLDEFEASLLPEGTNPFVSPEGEWVGFVDADALEKVAIGGGAAITLCRSTGFLAVSVGDRTIPSSSRRGGAEDCSESPPPGVSRKR